MIFDRLRDDNETYARQKIDVKLRDAGWLLVDSDENKRNVSLEHTSDKGRLDYLLLDSKNHPLCVLEAKKPSINPLSAKDQARRYAESQNIRFIILSNGEIFYLWDIKTGNPQIITQIPTQESLQTRLDYKNDGGDITREKIIPEYVALMKNPNLLETPEYLNPETKNAYLWDNGLRVLRDYQIGAVQAVQKAVADGRSRFLIEMATGLGKTLTAGAIIQMFLRTGHAHRVLFLVDRIELEEQAYKNFRDYLCDYTCVIYKHNSKDWFKAEVVISTIQTLMSGDRYKSIFSPTDFDFIISDEAHRSIGGNSRAVFEYFVGYKLGLTATPKDYVKNVDIDKIKIADPKALERRLLLDTYKTFGCDGNEPTYRYSMIDGVNNGYLIAPIAIDARTDITTELLSEKGYSAIGVDESGEDAEALVVAKDFEKNFFNENINSIFCKTFLENAMRDPISGEIGKSIVFCVTQEHAAKITQLLNQYAMQAFPEKYNSDFATQVTSLVANAQTMTTDFSNNKLNGRSRFKEGYETSKTRVCVTVGMMTTGYDCSDLLNIVFMRPVFSPTDFVQMKGRGTRKNTFKFVNADKNEFIVQKESFKLFDFFGNCEYFEEKFNYDSELKLPQITRGASAGIQTPQTVRMLTSEEITKLIQMTELPIKEMRIDREFWGAVKKEIADDTDIKQAVDNENWDRAVSLVRDRYENKPKLYPTLETIKKANKLDRHIGWREVLENVFGFLPKFKTKREMLEEESDKYVSIAKPNAEIVPIIKNFIELYLTDNRFREIIDKKDFPMLDTEIPGFSMADIKEMGIIQMNDLLNYIKDAIILNDYME
ncbi:MAG: DEAD/DEAH box helicase family protein [Alphaproteobacteria bacterium]|nr:DEAD/DEAH box helicase family protein [Alphaproteobacteria bacterium]MBN2675266.1 DEAD/DEAH box helicase family protein [Alphaproteobacteria bacterium]